MWLYPEVRTLGDSIAYHARRTPDRLALKHLDRAISFLDYDQVSNRFANALLAMDVPEGERVGFLGRNSPDFYFAFIGASKTRAAFTVLNWRLSAAELSVLIADSGARVVFVEREL